MRIVVAGDDRRFACLRELLEERGHDIVDCAEGAELMVTGWPPGQEAACGKIVSCGPGFAPEGVHDLLKDEEYQREIAWMSAEGAAAAAMGVTGCAVRGAKCMVVGWGRIGKALTEILIGLGADVTVLTRRTASISGILACGAHYWETSNADRIICGMRFVFSTAPAMVLDENVLKNARQDAVIIDLASPPYGVDVEAAAELGVAAWREPGIPGRYCPENAARAIYDGIVRAGLLKGGL